MCKNCPFFDPFFASLRLGVGTLRYHRSTEGLGGQPRASAVSSSVSSERVVSQDITSIHASSSANNRGFAGSHAITATAAAAAVTSMSHRPAPDAGVGQQPQQQQQPRQPRGEVFLATPFVAKRVFDHWKDITDRSGLCDGTAESTTTD